jgi:putative ABC transport system ATP-binding protein
VSTAKIRTRLWEANGMSPAPLPTFQPPNPSHGAGSQMSWWKRNAHPAGERPSETAPLVRLDQVSKVYPGESEEPAVALRDVSVEIARGEFVSVSGPSGCGKSTFLSILGMLDTPTSGRYCLSGRDVSRFTPAERARLRNIEIGLIFQSFNLIGDLTVYENVEYPLTLRGIAPDERRARTMAALERVGVASRKAQRPGSLSGGHQQLVAIARAVAGQPPMVLADEPTGNLDSASGDAVMDMIRELHRAGSTIVLATHNPRYLAMAERHVYLFDGRTQEAPTGP